jgi:hypothetical protein
VRIKEALIAAWRSRRAAADVAGESHVVGSDPTTARLAQWTAWARSSARDGARDRSIDVSANFNRSTIAQLASLIVDADPQPPEPVPRGAPLRQVGGSVSRPVNASRQTGRTPGAGRRTKIADGSRFGDNAANVRIRDASSG